MKTIEAGSDHTAKVIVETPRGSSNKYDYDPEQKLFYLKKVLPVGMVFPFDFGFIPDTIGEDGDPLDVIVLSDNPLFPGCQVVCRIIGVLKAMQVEVDGRRVQNDRLVGVFAYSILYESVSDVNDISLRIRQQIEHFFINYNELEGKHFEPSGWLGADDALAIINKQLQNR